MHSSSKLPARWRSSALRTGGSRRVSRAFFPSTSFSRQSSSSVGCEFSVALTITEAVGVFSDRNVSCWIPLSHRIRRLFSVSRKIDWRNFSFLCRGKTAAAALSTRTTISDFFTLRADCRVCFTSHYARKTVAIKLLSQLNQLWNIWYRRLS